MDNELRSMLEETVKVDLENIADMGIGTEERNSAIKDIAVLIDKLEDDEKSEENIRQNEERMKLEKRYKIIDWGVRIGLGLVELAVPLWWYTQRYHEAMAYEETGSFTSGTTKNFVRSMPFPVKRR